MNARRLAGVLTAAAGMLLLASTGAEQARSSTGCTGFPGFALELGVTNTCNTSTFLTGTAAKGLSVTSSAGGGTALAGLETGTGAAWGVQGESASAGNGSYGVIGELTASSPGTQSAAVYGQSASTSANGFAVWGLHQANTGSAPAVVGETGSGSDAAAGISAKLTNSNAGAGSAALKAESDSIFQDHGIGVWGLHAAQSGTAAAVLGESSSQSASAIGVEGSLDQTSVGSGSAGVFGISVGTNGNGIGVFGQHTHGGVGVLGQSASGVGLFGYSSGVGVVGYNPNAGGVAGYFSGNVTVTGTLTASAKNFRIDNPLDPAHSYLQHASVESSQLTDVYSGNVTTNARGFGTVRLPAWFQALNADFRYQLTSLSGLQEVAVAKEIRDNRFTIQSQRPHSRISWQVTGVRHDAYAREHPLRVVVAKRAVLDAPPRAMRKALSQTRR